MLTPRFTATQDADYVTLTVRVPHVRVGAAEVTVEDGSRVSFWCKPFLLQLVLPGEVIDDERLTAVYDPSDNNGTVIIRLPKAVPGMDFQDLDLAARLLAPRAIPPVSRLAGTSAAAPEVVDLMHVKAIDDDDGGIGNVAEAIGRMHVGRVDQVPQQMLGENGRFAKPPPSIEVISDDTCTAAVTDGASGLIAVSGAEPPSVASIDSTTAHGMSYVRYDDCERQHSTTAEPTARNSSPALLVSSIGIGFNRRFSGFFGGSASSTSSSTVAASRGLRDEFPALFPGLPSPDITPAATRRALRLADEEDVWFRRGGRERFAGDAADGDEDPLYQAAMAAPESTAWWSALQGQRGAVAAASNGVAVECHMLRLTADEEAALASLSRRELLVDGQRAGAVSARAATAGSGTPTSPDARDMRTRVRALDDALDVAFSPECSRLVLGLLPLLAAYAYDVRMTEGEASVESAWTVAMLSPLLSWADDEVAVPPTASAISHAGDTEVDARMSGSGSGGLTAVATRRFTRTEPLADATAAQVASVEVPSAPVEDVPVGKTAAAAAPADALRDSAVSFIRRVLLFPYLRRWDLALRCLQDAADILRFGGARGVLRALLSIRAMLSSHGEGYYLLNTLYIDDYCAWVARGGVSDVTLAAVGSAVALLAGNCEGSASSQGQSGLAPISRSDPALAAWNLQQLEECARDGYVLPLQSRGSSFGDGDESASNSDSETSSNDEAGDDDVDDA